METALPRCHLCQTQERVAEYHPFLFDLVPKTCLLCQQTVRQRRECIRILSSGGRLKDQPDQWVGPPLAETHGPDISGRQHRVGEAAPHWDDPHESICAICAKNASAGSYVKCGQCPLVWHHDCLQRASIAYAGDFASCPFCTGRDSLDPKDAGRMRGDPGYSVAKRWRVNQAKGKGRATAASTVSLASTSGSIFAVAADPLSQVPLGTAPPYVIAASPAALAVPHVHAVSRHGCRRRFFRAEAHALCRSATLSAGGEGGNDNAWQRGTVHGGAWHGDARHRARLPGLPTALSPRRSARYQALEAGGGWRDVVTALNAATPPVGGRLPGASCTRPPSHPPQHSLLPRRPLGGPAFRMENCEFHPAQRRAARAT